MEHLSNELFKQGDAKTSVYYPRKRRKQLWLDAPLVPPEPIRASASPKQAPPLRPGRNVRRQQSERRLFCETLAYVTKTVCQETQRDTITNLTAEPIRLRCSHRDLDLLTFVRLIIYVLYQQYCVFIITFFNVSIKQHCCRKCSL